MAGTTLVWLRNDLRIRDNPALAAGLTRGEVVVVYVDETDDALRRRGAASRWWLNGSLRALSADLAAIGIRLETIRGSILDAVREFKPAAVFWNRRYAPAERKIDEAVSAALETNGVEVGHFPGNVLVEPFDIATRNGGPFAVYTPFWNALRARDIPVPRRGSASHGEPIEPATADRDYRPEPWTRKLTQHWKIGEAAARARLSDFLDRIEDYPQGRDYPARPATSLLSPHLAHGEISARQIWHAAAALGQREPSKAASVQKFQMELAWRDFNVHQLYHRPDIATAPMRARFQRFKWRQSDEELAAWQQGRTGIAIIDAGMRELWQTGFMHNRVRLLTASLLTKNLLLDWKLGEQWFWDCLVDADSANNPGNWQWVAGCGNEAAPYFRIFNPESQAEKFDPGQEYVRRWGPEPRDPIVDLRSSRERALAAFRAI
jgi:deoxyribodipyrimidine photo-lyase